MFVLLIGSKRRYFRSFCAAIDAADPRKGVVIEWQWDGPTAGHHAMWHTERAYRNEAEPFAIIREC